MIRWLCAFLLLAAPAAAAEITVLSAGAVHGLAAAVKPAFEATTGDRVTLRNDTTGALVRRIRAGEAFDVVMISPAGLDSIADKLAPGTRAALASVGIGVGVRAGAPAPNIATPHAFRSAMRHARAVAYVDPASGATGGTYIARLFQSLGIAETMAAKSVLVPGGLAATAVADGRADIVLGQASEILAVPGVVLAGPLPEPIQMRTQYAGAIAAASPQKTAAAAFLRAMTEPGARALMAAHGLTAP